MFPFSIEAEQDLPCAGCFHPPCQGSGCEVFFAAAILSVYAVPSPEIWPGIDGNYHALTTYQGGRLLDQFRPRHEIEDGHRLDLGPAITPLCAIGVAIAIAFAQLWPGSPGMFDG